MCAKRTAVVAAALAFLLYAEAALADDPGPYDPLPANARGSVSTLSRGSVSNLTSGSVGTFGGGTGSLSAGSPSSLADGSGGLGEGVSELSAGAAELQQQEGDFGDGAAALRVSESEEEVLIEIGSDVLFDFDRWGIRPNAAVALSEVAQIISKYNGSRIDLHGHTDSIGSDNYNQDLSEKRAKSVKAWLVHRASVNPLRMHTSGFGKRRPVAPNTLEDGSDNPEGRQQNRRVEITVRKR